MSTTTDILAEAIADAVVARIGNITQATPQLTDVGNMLYPVPLICQELGKRPGTPMAYMTFKKHYLDTGILNLTDNPHDRRTRYVRLGDWLKLKKEIGK